MRVFGAFYCIGRFSVMVVIKPGRLDIIYRRASFRNTFLWMWRIRFADLRNYIKLENKAINLLLQSKALSTPMPIKQRNKPKHKLQHFAPVDNLSQFSGAIAGAFPKRYQEVLVVVFRGINVRETLRLKPASNKFATFGRDFQLQAFILRYFEKLIEVIPVY